MICAEPGMMPDQEAEQRAARDRHGGLAPFLPAGQQLGAAWRDDLADHVGGRRRQDSPRPNRPTATGTMPMPSPSSGMSND